MNASLEGLMPKIIATINDQLDAPFTAEEISEALSQMCPQRHLALMVSMQQSSSKNIGSM